MKYSRSKIVLVAVSLIAIWNVTAWLIANNYYLAREQKAVEQESQLSRERASDLADSIQRNLDYIDGIPDLVAQTVNAGNALSRFGSNVLPSSQPLEIRKRRWSDDPVLRKFSMYLRQVQANLHVDLVYAVNAAGDCVAAGNINTPGSSIGTNFSERDFFKANESGMRGMQYAVGKTTHIPGLYFSSPVFVNGHFMGAIVAKNDVPKLSSLINQIDAFVTDANGVIILARDKKREMLSLHGAPIAGISAKDRYDRYRRRDFPTLEIEPWGNRNQPSLMRVQNSDDPHVLMSKAIPEYGLNVYADTEVPEIRTLGRDEAWFAFLLGISGSVLILIASGAVLYVDSIRTTEIALDRANVAERRIITVSEETQQRIGRELHDDLGQQLTGIAFRSEVLFQSLKKRGLDDWEDAAEITGLINEAINKTRRLAQGLYPVEMQDAGLHGMLEQLAANVESIYRIECDFIHEGESKISDPLALISLYRISQEAVSNAIKHGRATKITMTMTTTPSDMMLQITDDGCGIGKRDGSDAKDGLGMHTMHYRASLLGATFQIAERPAGGTRVTITLPAQ